MCKKAIERAVNSVDCVSSANWDVDNKQIDVSFYDSKTDEMSILHDLAASGYDTENVAGNEEAYEGLPDCCKFDHEMKMN